MKWIRLFDWNKFRNWWLRKEKKWNKTLSSVSSNLELYKEFAEEAYSVALHPSGLYILVGFSDKTSSNEFAYWWHPHIQGIHNQGVQGGTCCSKQSLFFLLWILRNGLHIKESLWYFQCAFSNGGHLFAAVHGNIIAIYSTMTFEIVSNLKGHNGKVRAVIWSSDDSKIVSCGRYIAFGASLQRLGSNFLNISFPR